MADFKLYEHAGDDPFPVTEYDSLAAEYRSVRDQLDGATVQLQESATGAVQYQAEVSRLKSQNYDLVIAQQGKPETTTTEPERPGGIDGLFTHRRKN